MRATTIEPMRHLIEWVTRNRLLVVVCVLGVMGAGYQSYRHLPVDAFPDVSPALVQVFVETDGLAPEEIEKFVTYPVETAMNGLPGLDRIRSKIPAVTRVLLKAGMCCCLKRAAEPAGR